MGGQATETELRQRRPPIQHFQPSDEGRKRDEKLDQHIRYVPFVRCSKVLPQLLYPLPAMSLVAQ